MVARFLVRSFGIFVSLVVVLPAAQAQRDLTDIPDPDPVAEREAMTIDPAVEVNLFAADPMIRKPIQSNFDSLGRLWVASSQSYPQLEPGEKADDKILVLTDTDGDGVADSSTVFADGLLIPTGVIPDGTDAAYVAHATELLYLEDTDQDGIADRRRVVFSGFGTEDTHHLLHTLRWGPDGCLYFNQSIYIHSTIETAYGTRQLDGGGIWRYRPETGQLEVFCKGFVNPWGHVFDAYGQSFATDGAYFEGINYVFPDSIFVTSPGAPRWVGGMNPGSPKHCGLAILSGPHFPDSWQGDLVTNDFRSHRVCRFTLRPEGSSYQSRQQPELINSSHIAFRPIDAAIGGDGALYIADWYNPIIQHGEVDFRDDRRDRSRGRIWRVTVAGQPLAERPRYATLGINALVQLLGDSSLTVRQFARLELKRRPAEKVLAAVDAWVSAASDTADRQLRELEGMWIDECHNRVDDDRLERLLAAEDGRIRAAAVRTIGRRRDQIPRADNWLAEAVVDSYPQVRLEAVAALGRGSSAEDAEIALRALDQPIDASIEFALWNTVRSLSTAWSPRLAAGQFDFGNDPKRLVFLLSAAGNPAAAEPVVRAVEGTESRISLDDSQAAELLVPLSGIVDAAQLTRLLKVVLDPNRWQPNPQATLLAGMVNQAIARGLTPAGIEPVWVSSFVDSDNPAMRDALVKAAGGWKLIGMVPPMIDRLDQGQVTAEQQASRYQMLRSMGEIGSPEAIQYLVAMTKDQAADPAERTEAVVALIGPASAQGIDGFGRLLADPASRQPMIDRMGMILARKGLAEKIAPVIAETKITPDDARRMISVARSAGAPESLLETIRQSGEMADAGWKWSEAWRDDILRLAAEQGDPARGEIVYRRESLQCIKCHQIGPAGGLVGPNLVSLGGASTPEYVLRSLIEPNDKLKEGYNTIQVLTLDGRVVQGIPAGGDDETLMLRTAEGTVVSIPRGEIDAETNGQSLMPAGLLDPVSRDDLADLVSFLTALGRTPEYTVSTSQFIRSAEELVYSDDANRILNRTSTDAVATGDPAFIWQPIVSRVDGYFPINEMDRYRQHQGIPPTSYLRFDVQVGSDGKLDLAFSADEGIEMWLDGKPSPLSQVQDATLEPGTHTVILGLNAEAISDGIRILQK
jgi:putative heme-binding domain-containing protein